MTSYGATVLTSSANPISGVANLPIDLNLYLTPQTIQWLLDTLLQLHSSPPRSNDFIREHTNLVPEWYRHLLDITRSHEKENTEPRLTEAARPRGGYHWQVAEDIRRELEEEEDEEITEHLIG